MSEPQPGPSAHQLKIWALLILYQMAHHSRGDGFPKTWLLRFLLAFLYSHANGGDRAPFDGFWKAATKAKKEGKPDGTAAYERGMDMRAKANGICFAVGEEPKAIQEQFYRELSFDAAAKRSEKPRFR